MTSWSTIVAARISSKASRERRGRRGTTGSSMVISDVLSNDSVVVNKVKVEPRVPVLHIDMSSATYRE